MKNFIKSVLFKTLTTFLGFCIAFVLYGLILVVLMNGFRGRAEPLADNSVLLLKLDGELVERTKPLDFTWLLGLTEDERELGLYELTQAIRLAKSNDKIKGLYLHFGHFGAGWASTESLKRAIEDFKSSGKFVYAYSASYNELTYFLAASASKIFLQPSGELELNGLSMDSVFLKGLLEKLEIEPRIFRVGQFKSAVEPFLREQMSDENRKQYQTLVDDFWTVFKIGVLKPPVLEAADLERITTDLEISSPAEAFNKGLVQELAFEDEVIEAIAKAADNVDIEEAFVTPGHLLGQVLADQPSKNKIAVIFASGEIVSGIKNRDSIGAQSFINDLDEILEDDEVKAIVVRINSPGGDALASDEIWRKIMKTDQTMPVIASMGDIAASGGYYMAAGARHITAEASTLTGSIGVFGLMFETKKFFNQKLGVTFDQVNTHPYADLGNPNRPMNEKERAFIQTSVERVYQRFIEVVKESRKNLEPIDASTFAEGRIWSGARAKELGLVDDIGDLNAAIRKAAEFAKLAENDFEVDLYPRQKDRLEEIVGMVSGQISQKLLAETGLDLIQSHSLSPTFKSGIYTRLPFDLKIR